MNYTEKILYDYKTNCEKLSELQEQLKIISSIHGNNYQIIDFNANNINNPVINTFLTKEYINHKIKKLKRKIDPVRRLEEYLTCASSDIRLSQILKVLKEFYYEHKNLIDIAYSEGLNVWTIYKRRRELIRLVRRYINGVQ